MIRDILVAVAVFAVAILTAIAALTFVKGPSSDSTARTAAYRRPKALVRIDPKDNPGLLLAVMKTFQDTGRIYFQYMDDPLYGFSGAVLTPETIENVWKRIVWEPEDDCTVPKNERPLQGNFIHVWITVEDRCIFGAWDNFHEECVIATDEFPLEVLDRLAAEGVIRGYAIDTDPDNGRYWHRP